MTTEVLRLGMNTTAFEAGGKRMQASLVGVGNKLTKAQKALAGFGVILGVTVLGMALSSGVKGFIEFDSAMTSSLAIMGDVSAEMRDDMVGAAREVAVELNFAATEAGKAFFYLASAGLDAEQSIASLPPVADFARAGMFDLALATDLATDAQSALGLASANAQIHMVNMTRVTDVLVKANTLANATVEQFSTSLTTEAGAALKTFKIDVEEGVAVLAAFADQGVKGQVAGTGLSRILRLMTSAAVNNKEAYKDLNIEVFDSEGNIRNLADIIQDLEVATASMSDATRVASLEQLGFMARVQGVILPLLGTSEKIREYEAGLRAAGGTSKEIAGNQMLSLQNRIGQIGQSFRIWRDEMVERTVPAIELLIKHAYNLGDALKALLIVVGLTVATGLIAAFAALAPVVWGATTAFIAMIPAVTGLASAFALMTISAWPIMLALTAITGAIYLFIRAKRKERDEIVAAEEAEISAFESKKAALASLTEEQLRATRAQLGFAKMQQGALLRGGIGLTDMEGFNEATKKMEEIQLLQAEINNLLTEMGSSAEEGVRDALRELSAQEQASLDLLETLRTQTQEQERLLEATLLGTEAVAQTIRDLEREKAVREAVAEATAEDREEAIALANALRDLTEATEDAEYAAESLRTAGNRERELAQMREVLAAQGAGTAVLARLNLEHEKANLLATGSLSLVGKELEAYAEYVEILYQLKDAFAFVSEERSRQETVRDLQRELDYQIELVAAQEAGKAALDALTISMAGNAAVARIGEGATAEYIEQIRELAEAIAQVQLEASQSLVGARALAEPWEEALREIQRMFSSTFDDILRGEVDSFEDFSNEILDIFIGLAAEIAAVMTARALGLDELIKKLREADNLSQKQAIGASIGAGAAVGTISGSGSTGAVGGAAAGFAIGGPWGAVAGGVAGMISGLWESAKRAEEIAKQMKAAQRAFSDSMDDLIAGIVAATGSLTDQAIERIRTQIQDLIDSFITAFPADDPRFFDPEAWKLEPGLDAEEYIDALNQITQTLRPGTEAYEAWMKVVTAATALLEEQIEAQKKAEAAFMGELKVREAWILGQDEAAEAMRRNIDNEAELQNAREQGFSDAAIAELSRIQLLETQAQILAEMEESIRIQGDFLTNLQARERALSGDTVGAMTTTLIDQQQAELEAARDLVDQGIITEEMFLRLSNVLDQELANAIEEAIEVAARALEALSRALEATRAAIANLNVRGLSALGMGEAAEDAQMAERHRLERRGAEARGEGPAFVALVGLVQDIERSSLDSARALEAAEVASAEALNAELDGIDRQIEELSRAADSAEEAIGISREQLALASDSLREQQKAVALSRKVVESLSDFQDSILLSETSPLSPIQKLEEAQRQFDQAVAAARGGDTEATLEIPELARTLLEFSREVNASSLGFVSTFESVTGIVAELQAQYGDRLTVEEQILNALETQIEALERQIESSQAAAEAAQESAQSQIDALRLQAEEARAASEAELEMMRENARAEAEASAELLAEAQKEAEVEAIRKWADDSIALLNTQIDSLEAARAQAIADSEIQIQALNVAKATAEANSLAQIAILEALGAPEAQIQAYKDAAAQTIAAIDRQVGAVQDGTLLQVAAIDDQIAVLEAQKAQIAIDANRQIQAITDGAEGYGASVKDYIEYDQGKGDPAWTLDFIQGNKSIVDELKASNEELKAQVKLLSAGFIELSEKLDGVINETSKTTSAVKDGFRELTV